MAPRTAVVTTTALAAIFAVFFCVTALRCAARNPSGPRRPGVSRTATRSDYFGNYLITGYIKKVLFVLLKKHSAAGSSYWQTQPALPKKAKAAALRSVAALLLLAEPQMQAARHQRRLGCSAA